MALRARLAATAAAVFACGAIAAPDPRHLIDDGAAIHASVVKPLYVCDSFLCDYTAVDVKTEDWTDKTGSLHKDGCTARWGYRGFDVSGRIGSKLRWQLNPLDRESYYFDSAYGVTLNDDDKNERRLDLDQEGRDTGVDTFTWYDFNRRTRLGDYPGEPNPLKRGIRFDYKVYRVRGANGSPNPELCGSFDPVIYNRG